MSVEDITVMIGDLPDGFYVEDDGVGIPADRREHLFGSGVSTKDTGLELDFRWSSGSSLLTSGHFRNEEFY